jgi:hypothetical protein
MDRRNFFKTAGVALGGTLLAGPALADLDAHGKDVLKKVAEGDPEATKELADALSTPLELVQVYDPRFGRLTNREVNLKQDINYMFELGKLTPFTYRDYPVKITISLTFETSEVKRYFTFLAFVCSDKQIDFSNLGIKKLSDTAVHTVLTNCFSTHNVEFKHNDIRFFLESISYEAKDNEIL